MKMEEILTLAWMKADELSREFQFKHYKCLEKGVECEEYLNAANEWAEKAEQIWAMKT